MAWVVVAAAGCSSGDAPDERSGAGTKPAGSDTTIVTTTPEELLQATFEDLSPVGRLDQAMSLAYIERAFGSVTDVEWATPLVRSSVDQIEGSEDLADLAVYLRFLRAGVDAPAELEGEVIGPGGEVDTDAMVAAALWCDRLDAPEGFLDD